MQTKELMYHKMQPKILKLKGKNLKEYRMQKQVLKTQKELHRHKN